MKLPPLQNCFLMILFFTRKDLEHGPDINLPQNRRCKNEG